MMKSVLYQIIHFIIWAALGALYFLYRDKFSGESIGYLTAHQWFFLSWIIILIHHAWVVFFWRLEYHYEKISAWFGEAGFTIFRVGFVVLILASLFAIVPISIVTQATIEVNDTLKLVLITVTTPFIFWAVFSVIQFFGPNRAFGGDHFFEKYRNMPMENRGTFRYIPNSMYTIIFLLVYHPGLFYESFAGLLLGAMHHIFVWAHYFCTEKPDMKLIYGNRKDETK